MWELARRPTAVAATACITGTALVCSIMGVPAFAGSVPNPVGASASDGGDTVGVTVSGGSATPGSASPGNAGHGGGSGGISVTCISKPLTGLSVSLPAPVSSPGHWVLEICTYPNGTLEYSTVRWVSDLPPVAAAPALPEPPRSTPPSTAAAKAAALIHLPEPSIHENPSPSTFVNLPTWLWIDPSIWHPYSASASVGAVSATATATPVSVTWDMGDGSVVCSGPGTAYDPSVPASDQSTSCQFTYTDTSVGQPSTDGNPDDGAYPVKATVTWSVAWRSSVTKGGALPALTTSATTRIRVEQIQSVYQSN
ncbi:MAG: hypothetical protein ACYDD4_02315 [Acidimicrobiales bacterium]